MSDLSPKLRSLVTNVDGLSDEGLRVLALLYLLADGRHVVRLDFTKLRQGHTRRMLGVSYGLAAYVEALVARGLLEIISQDEVPEYRRADGEIIPSTIIRGVYQLCIGEAML